MYNYSCNKGKNSNIYTWSDSKSERTDSPPNKECCWKEAPKSGNCGTCDPNKACICNPGWQSGGGVGNAFCEQDISPGGGGGQAQETYCGHVGTKCDPNTYTLSPHKSNSNEYQCISKTKQLSCDIPGSGCQDMEGNPAFCSTCDNGKGECYAPPQQQNTGCVWGQVDGVLACGINPDDQGMVVIPQQGCTCTQSMPAPCPDSHYYTWDGGKMVCVPMPHKTVPPKNVPITSKNVPVKPKPKPTQPVKPKAKLNILAIVLPIVAVLVIGGAVAGYVFYMKKVKGKHTPRPARPMGRSMGRSMGFSNRRR